MRRFVRYLQHGLGGTGARRQVTDFVPVMHPIRQWADTVPWAALVSAIEQRFATRLPHPSSRGRRPVPSRVLVALEWLTPELGASDADLCQCVRTDVAVMDACGLRDDQGNPSQVHWVLPETLGACRRRMEAALREELRAIQAAAALEEGLVSPAPRVIDTVPSAQGSQRGTDAPTLSHGTQKTLARIARITQQGSRRATPLASPAPTLQQELTTVMRRVGRPGRGHGKVCVPLVRAPAQQLLALGQPSAALGQQAQHLLAQATALSEATRERFASALDAALRAPPPRRPPSLRRTQGHKRRHCQIVKAYDPTLAPIMQGQSHGPAPCGRQPGLASDSATGFLVAHRVPAGHPSAVRDVLPLLDKVERAREHVRTRPRLPIHSGAGDRGVKDATFRQALHARGILTVGIPKTVAPIQTPPSPQAVLAILNAAGVHRTRTPQHVPLACACGLSRLVVESPIASVLSRGAGHVRYNGFPGAVVQQGMTVMAHTSATSGRIRQQPLSKRAQKCRRLFGLRRHNVKQINRSKN